MSTFFHGYLVGLTHGEQAFPKFCEGLENTETLSWKGNFVLIANRAEILFQAPSNETYKIWSVSEQ